MRRRFVGDPPRAAWTTGKRRVESGLRRAQRKARGRARVLLKALVMLDLYSEDTPTARLVEDPRPLESLRDAAVAVAGAGVVSARSRDRWVLIDDFESGGRRYLVAELATGSPRTSTRNAYPISARDLLIVAKRAKGHSLKAIAIELGLPPSTVSAVLRRVSKGLGEAWAERLFGLRRGSPGRSRNVVSHARSTRSESCAKAATN